MDLSPKKRYRFVRNHHEPETKEMQDHQPPAEKKQKKSKTSPGVTKPVFPHKLALKDLLSKKTPGGGGLLSGGRSSAVCRRRGTAADIQKALKRGDLHSLLTLQSKPSIETLFKNIERNSNKKPKPKRKNNDNGSK